MLIDTTLKSYIDATASPTPIPGGGSVSALAGALSAALSTMVAQLSVGKKGYESVQEEMKDLLSSLKPMQEKLIQGVDRDCMAYDAFLAATKLPKDTDTQQEKRRKAIQTAVKEICRVPMGIAENALAVFNLAEKAFSLGRKDLVTDAAVAVFLARAAVRGALYNVRFNLRMLKDEGFIQKSLGRVVQMEEDVEKREKSVVTELDRLIRE
jgi:methenyltetrahydrofolate cyclohydrolase